MPQSGHGLPYAFAPREQTRVPLLLWTSPSYANRARLSVNCLRQQSDQALSHDHLYHTLLGLTELRNDYYQASLDMLSTCRDAAHGQI
jgi:lipid A ethanolaminephosphotransferase